MQTELISYRGRLKWKLRTTDFYDCADIEIDWSTFLPAHEGTKYERSRLIGSSKEFLLLRIEQPLRKWRSSLSAATVENWYKYLQNLVRWMVGHNIWAFSELTNDDLFEFFKSRKARHSNDVPSKAAIETNIKMFQDLWSLRHEYPRGIRINVNNVEDEIWGKCRYRESTPWQAMGEDVALTLIFDAMQWINDYGQFFVETTQLIYSEQRSWIGISKSKKDKLAQKLFADVCAQPIFREIAVKAGCKQNGQGFARAFTVTIGAAINVILFMVGQRVSEMLRLDAGCVDVRHDDYDQPISYICGIAAKKNGLVREWVAGDPVPEIIKWVEELHYPARKATGLKALFITRIQGSAIPLPGRELRRMSTASPVSAMRAFANAPFREDRPKAKRLHPHAARKTFAAFVVRRDKTALEALSLHFGHTYRAFTDGAYAGNLDLQKLLEQSDREELGRAITELLVSPHLAGRAAPLVENYRENGIRFRGKLTLQRNVDELISQGIRIAPCNWGYCLYSQPTSACGGDKVGPNELKRSPDVCASCANFVVSNAHAAWWNSRAEAEEAYIDKKSIPPQAREIVGKRLEKTREILRQLQELGKAKSSEVQQKK